MAPLQIFHDQASPLSPFSAYLHFSPVTVLDLNRATDASDLRTHSRHLEQRESWPRKSGFEEQGQRMRFEVPKSPMDKTRHWSTVSDNQEESELDLFPLYGDFGSDSIQELKIQDSQSATASSESDDDEWSELMADMQEALAAHKEEADAPWLRPVIQVVTSMLGGSIVEGEGLLERVAFALREEGFEAAVCQTSWPQVPGIPGGQHRFIDILPASDGPQAVQERVIIDPAFHSHFDIARRTPSFSHLLSSVPTVFVGTESSLLQLVDLLVEAMRMSLTAYDLPTGPWRRTRFMESKWTAIAQRVVPQSEASTSSFTSSDASAVSSPEELSCAVKSSGGVYAESLSRLFEVLPATSPELNSPSIEPALLSALAAKVARDTRQSHRQNRYSSGKISAYQDDMCHSVRAGSHRQHESARHVGMLHTLIRNSH